MLLLLPVYIAELFLLNLLNNDAATHFVRKLFVLFKNLYDKNVCGGKGVLYLWLTSMRQKGKRHPVSI